MIEGVYILSIKLHNSNMQADTDSAAQIQTEEIEMTEAQTPAPIVRGRMPAVIVFMIRFGNNKDEKTAALAQMFATTVGKIDDIRKNRNFAYVTANFKPTQALVDEGIAFLQQHPNYSNGSVDPLINELNSLPLATDEEAKAFEEAKTNARGQSRTTKDGEVADAGGGNRRGDKKPKAKAKAADTADTADGATDPEAGADSADAAATDAVSQSTAEALLG